MARVSAKSAAKKRQFFKKLPFSLMTSERKPANKAKKKHVRRRKPTWRLTIKATSSYSLAIKLQHRARAKRRLTKRQRLSLERWQRIFTMSLILFGLIGTTYFGHNLFKPAAPPPVIPTPNTVTLAEILQQTVQHDFLPRSKPVSLSIPDVGIKTSLITLGRNQDRTMETPSSYDVAGWYKHGPTPGELGPAVIVGHVDSYRGPAVFWRLSELTKGQLIKIRRADGSRVEFSVVSVRQFDQADFPTKKVFGNIDHAGLRLITCGGTFNRATGRYSHNTVVYAELVVKD